MAFQIYAGFLLITSAITFAVYLVDKWKAKRGAWRIPEKALLSLSFFGGGYGGYTAMFLAEHKIRKTYFHAVNLLGIAWQTVVLILLL